MCKLWRDSNRVRFRFAHDESAIRRESYYDLRVWNSNLTDTRVSYDLMEFDDLIKVESEDTCFFPSIIDVDKHKQPTLEITLQPHLPILHEYTLQSVIFQSQEHDGDTRWGYDARLQSLNAVNDWRPGLLFCL